MIPPIQVSAVGLIPCDLCQATGRLPGDRQCPQCLGTSLIDCEHEGCDFDSKECPICGTEFEPNEKRSDDYA